MQVGIPFAYSVWEVKLDKINHWIGVHRECTHIQINYWICVHREDFLVAMVY